MPVATSNSKSFPITPAGVQHAVAISVIDIGTQPPSGNFPARRKVMIAWELPNEKIPVKSADGLATIEMPRVISKDYTLSTDKKATLRNDLKSWRGRDFTAEEIKAFDIQSVIGANCLLNVIHVTKEKPDGPKTYANVGGLMPLAKGMPKLAPENKTLVFDIPSVMPVTFPDNMPEWVQNKIKASEEYKELINPGHHGPTDAEMANQSTEPTGEVPF